MTITESQRREALALCDKLATTIERVRADMEAAIAIMREVMDEAALLAETRRPLPPQFSRASLDARDAAVFAKLHELNVAHRAKPMPVPAWTDQDRIVPWDV